MVKVYFDSFEDCISKHIQDTCFVFGRDLPLSVLQPCPKVRPQSEAGGQYLE